MTASHYRVHDATAGSAMRWLGQHELRADGRALGVHMRGAGQAQPAQDLPRPAMIGFLIMKSPRY